MKRWLPFLLLTVSAFSAPRVSRETLLLQSSFENRIQQMLQGYDRAAFAVVDLVENSPAPLPSEALLLPIPPSSLDSEAFAIRYAKVNVFMRQGALPKELEKAIRSLFTHVAPIASFQLTQLRAEPKAKRTIAEWQIAEKQWKQKLTHRRWWRNHPYLLMMVVFPFLAALASLISLATIAFAGQRIARQLAELMNRQRLTPPVLTAVPLEQTPKAA